MSQASMRAAFYRERGPAAEVLSVETVARPEPGPGEVRVRLAVSAVNPTDVKIRSGATPREVDDFQVPHMDGAGTVDAVGGGVSPDRVGQRVWLMLAAHGSRWGTAAEWTVVPESRAVALPDDVSFELGACLGVPAVTAAECLFADGPVTGTDVLVAGGAGAVGRSAIQLAHWAGARVAATVSGDAKAAVARDAGADLVVNYRSGDAATTLSGWTPGVSRVVEVALGPNLDLDLAVSRPGTVVVTYAIDGEDPVVPVRPAMVAGVCLRFTLLYTVPPVRLAAAVAAVSAALRDGALTLPPVTMFDLADVAAAHEAQEAGPLGKVLLRI